MKSECNFTSNDDGGYEEHPLPSKKRENAALKKGGHLNDDRSKSHSDTAMMKSELGSSHCINALFNQSGSLTHLCETLVKITVSRRQTFTSSSEERCSGLGGLTHSDLGKHVYALRTEYIQRLSRPLLQKLMIHPSNKNIFNAPIDPIAQGVPNYFEKISKPMDLGTIRSNVQRGHYKTIEECFSDIILVFQNAIDFNTSDHPISKLTKELLAEAETEIASLKDECNKENKIKQSHNSFVGQVLAKQGLVSLPRNKLSSVSLNAEETVTTTAPSVSSDSTAVDNVPIAPPIFEGDFWILEYLRLTRQMNTKTKVSHGNSGSHSTSRACGIDKQTNQRRCRDYLKQMTVRSIVVAFLHPVDPVALNIPTYFNPMDLSIVREKLRTGSYLTMLDFVKDIRLTFENTMLFNPPNHAVHINNALTWLKDFHNNLKFDLMANEAASVQDANGTSIVIPRATRSENDTSTLDTFLANLSLLPTDNNCISAATTPRPQTETVQGFENSDSIPIQYIEGVVRGEPLVDSLYTQTMDVVAESTSTFPSCSRIVRHVTDSETEITTHLTKSNYARKLFKLGYGLRFFSFLCCVAKSSHVFGQSIVNPNENGHISSSASDVPSLDTTYNPINIINTSLLALIFAIVVFLFFYNRQAKQSAPSNVIESTNTEAIAIESNQAINDNALRTPADIDETYDCPIATLKCFDCNKKSNNLVDHYSMYELCEHKTVCLGCLAEENLVCKDCSSNSIEIESHIKRAMKALTLSSRKEIAIRLLESNNNFATDLSSLIKNINSVGLEEYHTTENYKRGKTKRGNTTGNFEITPEQGTWQGSKIECSNFRRSRLKKGSHIDVYNFKFKQNKAKVKKFLSNHLFQGNIELMANVVNGAEGCLACIQAFYYNKRRAKASIFETNHVHPVMKWFKQHLASRILGSKTFACIEKVKMNMDEPAFKRTLNDQEISGIPDLGYFIVTEDGNKFIHSCSEWKVPFNSGSLFCGSGYAEKEQAMAYAFCMIETLGHEVRVCELSDAIVNCIVIGVNYDNKEKYYVSERVFDREDFILMSLLTFCELTYDIVKDWFVGCEVSNIVDEKDESNTKCSVQSGSVDGIERISYGCNPLNSPIPSRHSHDSGGGVGGTTNKGRALKSIQSSSSNAPNASKNKSSTQSNNNNTSKSSGTQRGNVNNLYVGQGKENQTQSQKIMHLNEENFTRFKTASLVEKNYSVVKFMREI